ncbi:MAG TPA: hypothetical protein VLI93_13690 [Acetobacteraceae bacterium]|nr:hypothetical protein [Acetobacteraceae bacterium]
MTRLTFGLRNSFASRTNALDGRPRLLAIERRHRRHQFGDRMVMARYQHLSALLDQIEQGRPLVS